MKDIIMAIITPPLIIGIAVGILAGGGWLLVNYPIHCVYGLVIAFWAGWSYMLWDLG